MKKIVGFWFNFAASGICGEQKRYGKGGKARETEKEREVEAEAEILN